MDFIGSLTISGTDVHLFGDEGRPKLALETPQGEVILDFAPETYARVVNVIMGDEQPKLSGLKKCSVKVDWLMIDLVDETVLFQGEADGLELERQLPAVEIYSKDKKRVISLDLNTGQAEELCRRLRLMIDSQAAFKEALRPRAIQPGI